MIHLYIEKKNNIINNNIIGLVDRWGIHLSYPDKDSNLVVSENKIFADTCIAIDSNIPESGLIKNSIISVDDLKEKIGIDESGLNAFMTIPTLYKKKYLDRKFVYGCKSRRLKNLEKKD